MSTKLQEEIKNRGGRPTNITKEDIKEMYRLRMGEKKSYEAIGLIFNLERTSIWNHLQKIYGKDNIKLRKETGIESGLLQKEYSLKYYYKFLSKLPSKNSSSYKRKEDMKGINKIFDKKYGKVNQGKDYKDYLKDQTNREFLKKINESKTIRRKI